jgi:hypothetical protein
LGTIAKLKVERKEKSQKRLEKCRFFASEARMAVKNACYMRIYAVQTQGGTGILGIRSIPMAKLERSNSETRALECSGRAAELVPRAS